MNRKMILNEIRDNKLITAATFFFMTICAMLLSLSVMLFTELLTSSEKLSAKSVVPDYMQMHAGDIDKTAIEDFAKDNEYVLDYQISGFLNLVNSDIVIGSASLADSTQDNGVSVQGERFDYMLDMNGDLPIIQSGEIYVPVCYKDMYNVSVSEIMSVGAQDFVIAGFIRDAQMSSMLASSKRFLVCKEDYEKLRICGEEEFLIEFRLCENADVNVFAAEYAKAALPSNGPAVTKPLITMMNMLSDGIMIIIIFLVGVAVILISLLCIRFIMLIQMERDRQGVCTLKALGVSKRDVKRLFFEKYLVFSACSAVSGAAAAVILKIPLGAELRKLYGNANNGFIGIILGVAAAVLAEGILLLAIRKIISKTDKLSPIDAMSSYSGEKTKSSRSRFIITGITAALCMFITLVPQNVYTTISAPDFASYMGIGSSDLRIDVQRTDSVSEKTTALISTLSDDTDAERFCVLQSIVAAAQLPDSNAVVNLTIETGDHGVFPVKYSKGTYPKSIDEIALSSMNAEEMGVDVGSTICITTANFSRLCRVCGIYSDITNGGKTAKACFEVSGDEIIRSVINVSLAANADTNAFQQKYAEREIKVTDISDYIAGTYGQTLEMVRMASVVAAAASAVVSAVVALLFIRLTAERERSDISLKKALGFKNSAIVVSYIKKGVLPVLVGIVSGAVLGNIFGEKLCGLCLNLFGADSFEFVVNPIFAFAVLPIMLFVVSAAAVSAGAGCINKISAIECCRGKE